MFSGARAGSGENNSGARAASKHDDSETQTVGVSMFVCDMNITRGSRTYLGHDPPGGGGWSGPGSLSSW